MKKLGSIFLTAAFAAALCGGAAAAQNVTDLPTGWSKTAVENAIANGLLTAFEGKVYPERALTRAEMAAIINRAFGAQAKASVSKFDDVSASSWYYDDIAKSLQMQAFAGSDNKMYPERAITREEAFSVLARVFELQNQDASALDKFTDKQAVSSWAQGSVAALAKAGYVNGANGQLLPQKTITRAEFAQMMHTLAGTLPKSGDVITTNVSGNLLISAPGTTLKNLEISGDLILGDGIGSGTVTLENVTVRGRLVIRGGGPDTVKLTGSKIGGETVVHHVNHTVYLSAPAANLNQLRVKSSLIVDANVEQLTLEAPVQVNLRGGTVANAALTAAAKNASINLSAGAVIKSTAVYAENASITGDGKATQVNIHANGAKVTVGGARVTVAGGMTDVTAGGVSVPGGKTAIVLAGGNGARIETGNSGGGSSGGGSSTPDLVKTTADWVEVEKTGTLQVDFVQYATVTLKLDALVENEDFDAYTYYVGGKEQKIGDDVTKVLSLPTKNQLIVKILLDSNAENQELKLVKGKEYMTIRLGEIGSSVKN